MVKLYTSERCPKCIVLKTKLKKKGINFVESDKLEDLEDTGFKSLPVLEVDGKLMDFMNANIWVNARSNENNED